MIANIGKGEDLALEKTAKYRIEKKAPNIAKGSSSVLKYVTFATFASAHPGFAEVILAIFLLFFARGYAFNPGFNRFTRVINDHERHLCGWLSHYQVLLEDFREKLSGVAVSSQGVVQLIIAVIDLMKTFFP